MEEDKKSLDQAPRCVNAIFIPTLLFTISNDRHIATSAAPECVLTSMSSCAQITKSESATSAGQECT